MSPSSWAWVCRFVSRVTKLLCRGTPIAPQSLAEARRLRAQAAAKSSSSSSTPGLLSSKEPVCHSLEVGSPSERPPGEETVTVSEGPDPDLPPGMVAPSAGEHFFRRYYLRFALGFTALHPMPHHHHPLRIPAGSLRLLRRRNGGPKTRIQIPLQLLRGRRKHRQNPHRRRLWLRYLSRSLVPRLLSPQSALLLRQLPQRLPQRQGDWPLLQVYTIPR